MTTYRIGSAVALILLLIISAAAYAQDGTSIYVTQFRDLKAQLKTLAGRAETVAEQGTPSQKVRFQEDGVALMQLIHKLGQAAANSNLSRMKQGLDSSKSLFLVSVGAEALNLGVMALDALVDTGDRSFKAASRDAEAIAANLEKSM